MTPKRIYLFITCLALGYIAVGQNTTPEVNEPAAEATELDAVVTDDEVEMNLQEEIQAQPQPVPDLKESQNSSGYYEDQSNTWGRVANERQQDADAWDNYYRAERYGAVNNLSTDIDSEEQEHLDAIVDSMALVVPGSFEYNYCNYLNSNFDVNAGDYLIQAYELEPDNAETYDDLIAHYELTFDSKKKEEFCEKWLESGSLDQEVLDYNYNVLQSLDKNAILITNGELDTYPIWVLQEVDNVRPDVTVLNMNLMKNHSYRERKMADLGLTAYTDYNSDRTGFLEELGERNGSKSVYFALTVNEPVITKMQDNLYITGLALKFNDDSFDNISVLVDNWENSFETEYLDDLTITGTGGQMQQNYLVPLLTLNNYYLSIGDIDKASSISELALKLAKATRNEDEVEDYLNSK